MAGGLAFSLGCTAGEFVESRVDADVGDPPLRPRPESGPSEPEPTADAESTAVCPSRGTVAAGSPSCPSNAVDSPCGVKGPAPAWVAESRSLDVAAFSVRGTEGSANWWTMTTITATKSPPRTSPQTSIRSRPNSNGGGGELGFRLTFGRVGAFGSYCGATLKDGAAGGGTMDVGGLRGE